MGRKSQLKQNSRKQSGKENKFLYQKRRELSVLIDKLLRLTSIFQATASPPKSWEHHLEIDSLIRNIINIESQPKSGAIPRQKCIEEYYCWLRENGVQFDGVEIADFEGYELGLKATKEFSEGSLILTVPSKVMMTEKDAQDSELAEFIATNTMLQNMPNITLALFLLLQKNNPDSFWKSYINTLPEKYSTILYFNTEELAELKPSPVFESSLKLYRSIARQYAYFYNKIHTMDFAVLKSLREIFTFESYRWAVSTVMTRQNKIQIENNDVTSFIPLWDMCNHEHGKITTDFNKEMDRGDCYALRNFKANEQIFIFYGARSNADFFLHNGFVYPHNSYDSLSISLGVSSSDPLREGKQLLLGKLGLASITHYTLYKGETPISGDLLAFIRIFNMNQDELTEWSQHNIPHALVSWEGEVSAALDRRACTFLITRCSLLNAAYVCQQRDHPPDTATQSQHRKNIQLLKESDVQILNDAMMYLIKAARKLPADEKQ